MSRVASAESTGRGPYVGSLTRTTHRWVLDQVYEHVMAAGYDDLSRAQVGIFRYPGPDGMRPSEVAELLQITKQSVNDVLGDMEARGYLTREPHPTDGRARVVRLTAKGRRVDRIARAASKSCQDAIAELLGPRRFTQFHDALTEIVTHIKNEGLRVGSEA